MGEKRWLSQETSRCRGRGPSLVGSHGWPAASRQPQAQICLLCLPAPEDKRRDWEGPGRDIVPPAVGPQSRSAAGDGPVPACEAAAVGGLPGLPGKGLPGPRAWGGGHLSCWKQPHMPAYHPPLLSGMRAVCLRFWNVRLGLGSKSLTFAIVLWFSFTLH